MTFLNLIEGTPEWHKHRLGFINGSEIAALFGVEEKPDEYEDLGDICAAYGDSVFSLHYVKSRTIKPREVSGDLLDAGRYMEPSIAHYACHKRGWQTIKGRRAVDDVCPGMAASLDYEITDAGADAGGVEADGFRVLRGIGPVQGPGVFQIKNVTERQFRRAWVGSEPPLYTILQVQQEIACAGYTWGVVGAWVGGNALRLYFYDAHPGIIAMIRERITAFWDRVRSATPPAADGSDATSYALRELFPVLHDNEDAPLDLSGNNELPELCARLGELAQARLSASKDEECVKNRLKDLMGGSRYATCNGWRIKISVTPENPGREPKPGERIGAKQEVRRIYTKETV